MAAAGTNTHNSLSTCPTNLKEAIDWVLRVTNKDNQNGSTDNNCGELGRAVKLLLDNANLDGNSDMDKLFGGNVQDNKQVELVKALLNGNGTGSSDSSCSGNRNAICCLIYKLGDALQKFIGWENGKGTVGNNGIGKQNNYKSSYENTATWDGSDGETDNMARIFLGIIPLLFGSLSYLYWICDKWGTNQKLTKDDKLTHFMKSVGYKTDQLNDKNDGKEMTGSDIANLLGNGNINGGGNGGFKEFDKAAEEAAKKKEGRQPGSSGSTSTSTNGIKLSHTPYTKFLKLVYDKGTDSAKDKPTDCPLLSLY